MVGTVFLNTAPVGFASWTIYYALALSLSDSGLASSSDAHYASQPHGQKTPRYQKNEQDNKFTNNKEIQRIQIRLNNYNNKYDWWISSKDAD